MDTARQQYATVPNSRDPLPSPKGPFMVQPSPPRRTTAITAITAITGMAAFAVAGIAVTAGTAAAAPKPAAQPAASALAVQSAAQLVASRPAALHASASDAFVAHPVISVPQGLQYVPYDRTYKGLPVIGGDFVVVTDAAGHVKSTTVQQSSTINVSTTATLTAPKAATTARGQAAGKTVDAVSAGRKVVLALGTPRLAWETVVTSHKGAIPSKLHVFTDAKTGAVAYSYDEVREGDGTAHYNGPSPLHIDTTKVSTTSYSMKDPLRPGISCRDFTSKAVLTGSDDLWGNGTTNQETGCVDALFDVQHEWSMLSAWLGRNGIDGNGNGYPISMGLNDVNAYYDGTQVAVGHNNAGDNISVLDVVGHEFGHGVDDHTPGGLGSSAVAEFTADVFGAMTEAYAAESTTYDAPDYTVGEKVNLVGNGPIRYMYNPSLAGDANCYSSSIPSAETHAAAGPGNHWFYLVAEGTDPTDGQPASTTCNGGGAITGIGIQAAGKIFYNAMLTKTTSMSYLKYRTATLTAAKNLYPNDCSKFAVVKAAWDAVSVPAQTADPTCAGGTGGGTGTCSGQKLGNPGFETGTAAPWTTSTGVIDNTTGEAAHSGTWKAWMNGYGSTHTDTLTQSVAIPTGCHATLSFWLHIDTAETGTTAYDKLTVKAGTTTLATYSNTNAATGYTQKTFDVSTLAGQTITVSFSGVEDTSLQTSFVVDDTALTLS